MTDYAQDIKILMKEKIATIAQGKKEKVAEEIQVTEVVIAKEERVTEEIEVKEQIVAATKCVSLEKVFPFEYQDLIFDDMNTPGIHIIKSIFDTIDQKEICKTHSIKVSLEEEKEVVAALIKGGEEITTGKCTQEEYDANNCVYKNDLDKPCNDFRWSSGYTDQCVVVNPAGGISEHEEESL